LTEKWASAPGNLDIPPDVLDRFASCVANAAVEGLTSEEIEELDAHVSRGHIPDSYLLERANSRLNEIATHTNDHDFSVLDQPALWMSKNLGDTASGMRFPRQAGRSIPMRLSPLSRHIERAGPNAALGLRSNQ
jgi:hypothetical protein